jgi:hypothetical protein
MYAIASIALCNGRPAANHLWSDCGGDLKLSERGRIQDQRVCKAHWFSRFPTSLPFSRTSRYSKETS